MDTADLGGRACTVVTAPKEVVRKFAVRDSRFAPRECERYSNRGTFIWSFCHCKKGTPDPFLVILQNSGRNLIMLDQLISQLRTDSPPKHCSIMVDLNPFKRRLADSVSFREAQHDYPSQRVTLFCIPQVTLISSKPPRLFRIIA